MQDSMQEETHFFFERYLNASNDQYHYIVYHRTTIDFRPKIGQEDPGIEL